MYTTQQWEGNESINLIIRPICPTHPIRPKVPKNKSVNNDYFVRHHSVTDVFT